MKNSFLSLLFLLFLIPVLSLSGCSLTPEAYDEPLLTFDHLEKQELPVARIQFLNQYNPPMDNGHIEYKTRNAPVTSLQKWLEKRFVPANTQGTMRMFVEEASLVKRDLPVTDSIFGVFNVEPSQEYKARIFSKIEFLDDNGALQASYNIRAERQVSLPNNATLVEKDRTIFRLMESLMQSIDTEMLKIVDDYKSDYSL